MQSYQLGAAASFDYPTKFGDHRNLSKSQIRMFIKLAFELGYEIIFLSHPITWLRLVNKNINFRP